MTAYMKRIHLVTALLLTIPFFASAQVSPCGRYSQRQDISWFVPGDGHDFDETVPTPYDVLGYSLGDVFVDYSDAVRYMEALERVSDKVSIKRFGKTWAGKTFMQVCVSSPENIRNLESIREDHLQACSSVSEGYDGPLVVSLMGAIHGNEASGATAPLIEAYYFAACRDKAVLDMLERTVIVITPAQNPDGVSRFAAWANYNNSYNPQADPLQRESNEMWPSSRCNHYFADCNRDWLAIQQPEGRNCVAMYHEWLPDVVLDMHEQGSSKNGLFYFSPGDPDRTWKDIPEKNQELTREIGRMTASVMTGYGERYFTERGYDDFYIGKGAAYGDVQGSVCILHEQTATYGHMRRLKGSDTVLEFPRTVRNQTAASIGVVMRADTLRDELIRYHRDFFKMQASSAAEDSVKAIRFSCGSDKARAWHLVSTLLDHDIEVWSDAACDGAYIVPMQQERYFLARAMFDKVTEFNDSTFYDISTWTFPCAYAAKEERLSSEDGILGERITAASAPAGSVDGGTSENGYIIPSEGFYVPRAIAAALRKGLHVEVSTSAFTYQQKGGKRQFAAGSVVIPAAGQPLEADELHAFVESLASECILDVTSMKTDKLKGENLVAVREPSVAIICGRGMGIAETGEAWMLSDARLNLNHALVEYRKVTGKDTGLDRYTTIIMAGGYPSEPTDSSFFRTISDWVADGGTLILSTGASKVSESAGLGNITPHLAKGISGVIFKAEPEVPTSPLLWGVDTEELTTFKMTGTTYSIPDSEAILSYGGYVSGYASEDNKARISGSPLLTLRNVGKGKVIFIASDFNFRSYWFGTSRIFANAMMFGELL